MSFPIDAEVRARVDQAVDAFGRLEERVSSLSGATLSLSRVAEVAGGFIVAQLATRVGGAIEDFVGGAVDRFADFERAIAEIVAGTGALGDEAARLREEFGRAAKAAALELGVSTTQAAAALEALVKAGMAGDQALAALTSALHLAQIEQIDAGEASNLLVSTLAQFGLTASEATMAVDALVNASRLGIGTASEYAGGLSYVGAAAASLGFTLQETLAALVLVDATQKDAVKSGRLLNAMLSDLIQHSDRLGFSLYDTRGNLLGLDQIVANLTARLEGFATEAERNAYLQEVFGEQGRRAALALIGQSRALAELAGKIGEAGAAQEMFNTVMDTFRGRMARAQAAVEQVQLRLGAALAPIVEVLASLLQERLLPALEGFLDWLARLWPTIEREVAPILALLDRTLEELWAAFTALIEAITGTSLESEEAGSVIGRLIAGALLPLVGALKVVEMAVRGVTMVIEGWKIILGALQEAVQQAGQVWAQVARSMKEVWDRTVGAIIRSAQRLIATITGLFTRLQRQLVGGSIWTDLVETMVATTDQGFTAIERRAHQFAARVSRAVGFSLPGLNGPLSRGGAALRLDVNVWVSGQADRELAARLGQLIAREVRLRVRP